MKILLNAPADWPKKFCQIPKAGATSLDTSFFQLFEVSGSFATLSGQPGA